MKNFLSVLMALSFLASIAVFTVINTYFSKDKLLIENVEALADAKVIKTCFFNSVFLEGQMYYPCDPRTGEGMIGPCGEIADGVGYNSDSCYK